MAQDPKVKIVLLPTNEYDRRSYAERYENTTYKTFKEAREVFGENAGICELTDFMDMCNDQEMNLEQYWITYITITD